MASIPPWERAALDDLENTDLSMKEIGVKYGRSPDTIRKLKKFYNLTRKLPPRKRGQSKASEAISMSPYHRALGSRLTVYRGNKTLTDVSTKLGTSRYVTKMMELGAHDFTLRELIRISEIMGQPIQDLITPVSLTKPAAVYKEGTS